MEHSSVQTPARQPDRRTFLMTGLVAGLTTLTSLGGVACSVRPPGPPTPTPTPTPCVTPTPLSPISPGVLVTTGVLTWGGDANVSGAPYVFRDGNGDILGFEVDIANALAQLMGITPQFYQTSYSLLDQPLQSRQIDLILNGWEITGTRLNVESFSDPYYQYSQQIVVRKHDTHFTKYTDQSQIMLAELQSSNFKWGTGTGYKAADLLTNAGITAMTFDDPLKALTNGAVDIIMIDTPIVVYYVLGKGKNAVANNALRPIGKPLFSDSMSRYVMAFKKGDRNADKLLVTINTALGILKKNGTLKNIYVNWGLWDGHQTDVGIVDPPTYCS